MRRHFRFVAGHPGGYRLRDPHGVAGEVLRSLGSTLVGSVQVRPDGVDITLADLRSRDDLLRELAVASRRLGLVIAQVEVTEFLDALVVGPGAGTLTALGVGAKTRHLLASLAAGVIVGIAATYLAQQFPVPIQRYMTVRLEDDTWQVVSLSTLTDPPAP